MKTFKYEWVIPTSMAKGSGKSKKGDKGKFSKKQAAPRKPHRFNPIRTSRHESSMTEVSAKRAFLTSFILFSIILAPICGIGAYFTREFDAIVGLFSGREEAFVIGMAIGVVIAFMISILFTRKAIAQPS